MNIDQALIALCRKHDLSALSVQAMPSETRASGFVFTSFAHWERGDNMQCRNANCATASEAIAHAIQQVNEARACVVDVPAMELGDDLNDPTECMNTEEYLDYVKAGAA